jgi:hypothetical protein
MPPPGSSLWLHQYFHQYHHHQECRQSSATQKQVISKAIHLRPAKHIVAKLTRFSSSVLCMQYDRPWFVHQFLTSILAILPGSAGTLCRSEASQDKVNFLSSGRCPHSTPASILKTPANAKQVMFSLHSMKAVGSASTFVWNYSSRSETVTLVAGNSSHRHLSCGWSQPSIAPTHALSPRAAELCCNTPCYGCPNCYY